MIDKDFQMKQYYRDGFRNLYPKTKSRNVTSDSGVTVEKSLTDMLKEIKDFKDTIADLVGGTSVLDYGAVGDGIADDTQAIINALDNEDRLILSGKHRITKPILKSITSDLQIIGNNATIICDFIDHYEYGIRFSGSGVKISVTDLKIDGRKKTNKPIEVINEKIGLSKTNSSNVLIDNVEVINVKRMREFIGGAGITIRGNFETALINNVIVYDCEMPSGQGIGGSQGIGGLSISHWGEQCYVQNTYVLSSRIEKVYSSDYSYTRDQDGMICNAPTGKNVFARLIIRDTNFKDCFVRSIKSQVNDTIIDGCKFENLSGLTENHIGDSVALQYGGNILNCTFIYKNGYSANNVISVGSADNLYKSRAVIENIYVFNTGNGAVPKFLNSYPRDGYMSRIDVKNINFYGPVGEFIDYRVSGDKNMLTVKECYLDYIRTTNVDKALIYVRASGMSPYYANIKVQDVFYDGVGSIMVVKDRIVGVVVNTTKVLENNIGFTG